MKNLLPRPARLVWLMPVAMFLCLSSALAQELPVTGKAESPLILLQAEPEAGASNDTTKAYGGEVVAKEGADYVAVKKDQVVAGHKGFGNWGATFRYKLDPKVRPGEYTFWARWSQGGDPKVCVQTFRIQAGPDAEKLEDRGSASLRFPAAWKMQWIQASQTITIKEGDTVLEIKNSGQGDGAKAYDAFLLSPGKPVASAAPAPEAKAAAETAATPAPAQPAGPIALPVQPSASNPVIVLAFGKTNPLRAPSASQSEPHLLATLGTIVSQEGAQYATLGADQATLAHKGFGTWSGTFNFEIPSDFKPGRYRFHARYKTGGEVSQVQQTFTVSAGPTEQDLGTRAVFRTVNREPWQYQWVTANGEVPLFPGDRVIRIANAGKADGAKVFSGFVLEYRSSVPDWITAQSTLLRNRFLALRKDVTAPQQRIYVLDGAGKVGDIIMQGLADPSLASRYENSQVNYLLGEEADAMAREMGLDAPPALILADSLYSVTGVLKDARDPADVVAFVRDLSRGQSIASRAVPTPKSVALRNGSPEAWLVGGVNDGRGGISIYGLDTERVARPNPDQPYLESRMMGGSIQKWTPAPVENDGRVFVFKQAHHSYGWSRGVGYAVLYLQTDRDLETRLHLQHNGIDTAAWLDGQPVDVQDNRNPPKDFPQRGSAGEKKEMEGLTTEGLRVTALSEKAQGPRLIPIKLSAGWHCLLLKLTMQLDRGESFWFVSRFLDATGQPSDSLKAQVSDPTADLALAARAGKLRPLVYNNAPGNLPREGEPLRIRVDMRWHPVSEERELPVPVLPFRAKLIVSMTDMDGREIASRQIESTFPGEQTLDFGTAPTTGYYALWPRLVSSEGELIHAFYADGFTVVPGNASQKARLASKKTWDNYYYSLGDGDKCFQQEGGYFNWLERSGVYQNFGSWPGWNPQHAPKWEDARQRGIVLWGDTAGDSSWLNDDMKTGLETINTLANYTRFFKCANEIDIWTEEGQQKLREPSHWVARAKWEYEAVHAARSDGHYVGGSLVRPGDMNQRTKSSKALPAGKWFVECLKLDLDKYHDAWDVHAYPQFAPKLGGTIGNSPIEDERGVLAAYKVVGRENKLPFWLGECGAKAAHNAAGRRGQAEQTAKMIAWVNSRADYLGLAFCIGHEYDWGRGRLWDYSMGHKPGEAAQVTASALIDGLPYKPVEIQSNDIQAANFGSTFMIWSLNSPRSYKVPLQGAGPWVMVDVVGKVSPLNAGSDRTATVTITSSPIYILPESDYRQLTRRD